MPHVLIIADNEIPWERTRELRDLLQESGVPPWQRARLPLLFDADDRLLAVADLYLSEHATALLPPNTAGIEWDTAEGAPSAHDAVPN